MPERDLQKEANMTLAIISQKYTRIIQMFTFRTRGNTTGRLLNKSLCFISEPDAPRSSNESQLLLQESFANRIQMLHDRKHVPHPRHERE